MVEITILAIQPFHPLGILINPKVVLAWLNFDMYLAVCEPAFVPLFLVGILTRLGVEMVLRD